MRIQFYFDFISPYAYLTWRELPKMKQRLPKLDIALMPVLFAGLLNHWGQKGPAEIKPKRDYVFTHCLRYALRQDIPFTLPKYHPFSPLLSLRVALKACGEALQPQIIEAIWQAGWGKGEDISQRAVLVSALNQAKLPGEALISKAESTEIKQQLKSNTEQAINQGVFGVPTFVTDDNTLFWGLDSMEDLVMHLKGQEPITKKL